LQESEAMQIGVALYGAARVVIGQPRVEVSFDTPTIALGQVVEKLIAAYPRVRPYLLDESGILPSHIRVLINEVRPDPDATLATVLRDGDRLALLVAVAGGEQPSPFLALCRALCGKLIAHQAQRRLQDGATVLE
jgi:molybdopterin converting factor small subunit